MATDTYPPDKQRPALLAFAKALGCRDNALRRDECGDRRFNGTHGHIYAVPGSLDRPRTPGFQIFVMGWSANGWNRARKAISTFADVTNDGDDEGALFVDRLPTAEEAEVIRHWCGIAKRQTYTEEQLVGMRERARSMAAARNNGSGASLDASPGHPPTLEAETR
jgi:hypothetical protein